MKLSVRNALFGASSCLVTMLVSSSAFAAPENFRVGYVDMQKALSSSKAGVEAQKKYEAEVKKAQATIDGKKSDFDKLKADIDKQKNSLSDRAKVDKEEELRSKEKDLTRNVQDTREQLRRRNAMLVGELVKKLRGVVGEVGKAEGFTLILEKDNPALIYADAQIDITDSVVKKFDSQGQ